MSVQIVSYNATQGVRVFDSLDGLAALLPDDTVWVDIESVSGDELLVVAKHFGLHELSVEDCLTPGHFPKFEEFSDHLFMILRTLKPIAALEQLLDLDNDEEKDERANDPHRHRHTDRPPELHLTRKVALFLGRHFTVTFRRGEVQWLDALSRQVRQTPDRTIGRSVDMVAHAVVDVLVDRFMRGVATFDRFIDRFEDQALNEPENFDVKAALGLKPELIALREVARDQRRVILKLSKESGRFIRRSRRLYFEDVDDHAITVVKALEKQIDDLIAVRDGHIAMANARLSDTMRVLTVITTIAAPLNVLVGLYGMNFRTIPLLEHPYGFWAMCALIVGISSTLLIFFRRRRWL